jgi:hypothetical protein
MAFVLRLETSDEGLETTQHPGLDAVADARAVDVPSDEAGLLEDLEVLRDGGLGEGKLAHDVAAHAGLAAFQESKDGDPGRVANGLGEERQLLVRLGAFYRAEVGLLLGPRGGGADLRLPG